VLPEKDWRYIQKVTLNIAATDANSAVNVNQKKKLMFTTTATASQNAKDANGTPILTHQEMPHS